MKTPTLSTNCVHRSLGQCALLVVSLALACFALPPMLQAIEPCANCRSLSSTSLGIGTLQNLGGLTMGDTAIGFEAMKSTTNGQRNTAIGVNALEENITGNDNTAIGWQALVSTTLLSTRLLAGKHSPPTESATATPTAAPPNAPSNLRGSVVSSSQINLRWTDNANNEDGFELQRADGGNGATPQCGTFVTIQPSCLFQSRS